MDKLSLKRQYKPCFSILESDKKAFLRKVAEVGKEKRCLIELRLDYLFNAGMTIDEVLLLIAKAKTVCGGKKLIATIRTLSEGGYVDLSKEKYFFYIKMLYLKTKVHAIDVEYKYYKIDRKYYDSLFAKKKKDIIISMHFFNRVFSEGEYRKMFKEMSESKGNIVKFAIKTFTKEDLFMYLKTARKARELFRNNRKKVVFIAMGDIGRISRIIPEYTNTQIVFLSCYDHEDENIGKISLNDFNKYRKLLEKKLKN